jgi:hypothetical protein
MASADLKGAYRDRQAWMENLIADRTLSRGELAVAMCLAFHKNLTSGQCNPSLDRIAKHTGIKVRGAQHALSSLESRGWIKRQIGGRGPRSTTQYDLLRVQYLAPLDQPPRVQENDVRVQANADEGATVEAVGCSKMHPNLKNINLNHDGTVCADPPHSPLIENLNGSEERLPTDSEIDAGFEVFWRQHPRAVHQGKARTEYRKAIKSGKVTIAQIQHAAMAYAAARWEANQDHYTLPAAKWLAEECWGDDPRAHALGARDGWTRSQLARMAERSAENERLGQEREQERRRKGRQRRHLRRTRDGPKSAKCYAQRSARRTSRVSFPRQSLRRSNSAPCDCARLRPTMRAKSKSGSATSCSNFGKPKMRTCNQSQCWSEASACGAPDELLTLAPSAAR